MGLVLVLYQDENVLLRNGMNNKKRPECFRSAFWQWGVLTMGLQNGNGKSDTTGCVNVILEQM